MSEKSSKKYKVTVRMDDVTEQEIRDYIEISYTKSINALMFSQSCNKKDIKLKRQIDKKLRDKIIEKKLAHGQKPEQSEYQNDWEQNM